MPHNYFLKNIKNLKTVVVTFDLERSKNALLLAAEIKHNSFV